MEKEQKVSQIRVDEISVDTRVSIREENDEETIERYEDILESLPPITVFRRDGGYLLADGFHRLAAAERRGWKYIDADIMEGGEEEASVFSITANVKHGRPLTSREYEKAVMRLRDLKPSWTQERLGEALSRSRRWVGSVLAAERVGEFVATVATKMDMSTREVISRAPKRFWKEICERAEEEGWSREETRERVQAIKAEPDRAHEILNPIKIMIPEVPADKLIPLMKDIKKVRDTLEKFGEKLDPSVYEWGTGALAVQVLQGLYVLGEEMGRVAEKTRIIIEFLESMRKK